MKSCLEKLDLFAGLANIFAENLVQMLMNDFECKTLTQFFN